ncbi:hypothetical protein Cni_G10185 [Canna indica]|uniref:Uncharacterized protein n=1 Tax=Canna indica TaxID=4628 RepID=A0AAQ3Q8C4_9LILI|nr:hypothetical protein Cni_G10185 [Canna indica]
MYVLYDKRWRRPPPIDTEIVGSTSTSLVLEAETTCGLSKKKGLTDLWQGKKNKGIGIYMYVVKCSSFKCGILSDTKATNRSLSQYTSNSDGGCEQSLLFNFHILKQFLHPNSQYLRYISSMVDRTPHSSKAFRGHHKKEPWPPKSPTSLLLMTATTASTMPRTRSFLVVTFVILLLLNSSAGQAEIIFDGSVSPNPSQLLSKMRIRKVLAEFTLDYDYGMHNSKHEPRRGKTGPSNRNP